MSYESNFPTGQTEFTSAESIEHHGQITLSDEERQYLQQVVLKQFEAHPSLEGVKIQKLELKKVPGAIQEKIRSLEGKITAFLSVRIQKEVPLHQHTTDGEIYFGGHDGLVTLLDESKQEIGQFELGDEQFAVANIGEWHSVKTESKTGTTFFGVKFTTG